VLGKSPRDLGLEQVYDVAHNIAKIEEHNVEGKKMAVCVHRKGATRAFPAGIRFYRKPIRKSASRCLFPGIWGAALLWRWERR